MKSRLVTMVLLPAVALSTAAGLLALRDPDPDAVPSLQEVSDRTISPYCAPLTLSECPSIQAAELRQEIGDKVDAGWSNRRIDAWLVTNFGAWLVGNPGDAAAELFPAFAILVGGIAIAVFLSRRSAPDRHEPGPPPMESPELDQVRRELAEFRMGSE